MSFELSNYFEIEISINFKSSYLKLIFQEIITIQLKIESIFGIMKHYKKVMKWARRELNPRHQG